MVKNLRHELRKDVEVARRLLERLAPYLKDDEQAQLDAVEGQTDLFETIDSGLERLDDIEDKVDGIKRRMEVLKARCDRLKAQDEAIRSAIMDALDTVGLKTVERPLATITVADVPRDVEILNEAEIPPRFWKQPKVPDPKVDKTELKAALVAGEKIEGARLDNGGKTLKLRRK